MAEVFFENPPVLTGTAEEQAKQLYNYLFTVSDKLNAAMNSIGTEQMDEQTKMAIVSAAGNAEETQKAKDSLKSLIIKTAEKINVVMDELRSTLQSNIEAVSDEFGVYRQSITEEITETAMGVLREFDITERIEGLETDTAAFSQRINQYIYTGVVETTGGLQKVGIAIGEGVTAYDQDGNPYLNNEQKMATFTMDELAFWQGSTKVAYITNNILHIPKGEITDYMKIGNFMLKALENGAMAIIKA